MNHRPQWSAYRFAPWRGLALIVNKNTQTSGECRLQRATFCADSAKFTTHFLFKTA